MLFHLITLYQRHISPHKGFRCGYAVLCESESCSQFSKRAIGHYGWAVGLRLTLDRMRRCGQTVRRHRGQLTIKNSRRTRKNKDEDICSLGICGCDLFMHSIGTFVRLLRPRRQTTSPDGCDIGPCDIQGADAGCDIAGCVPIP